MINENHTDMNSIILYHGSPIRTFTPVYNAEQSKNEYGSGFYMTLYPELAKEWALCKNNTQGWLHTYKLNLSDLKIFDFNKASTLNWLAELMSHRDADSSLRYKKLAPEFIRKFRTDISDYDVISRMRADSSFFQFANDL